MEKKKNRKSGSTLLLVLVFLVGLSLLLYPTVSDYWNTLHQTKAVMNYVEGVSNLNSEEYDRILEEARDYNRRHLQKTNPYRMTEEEEAEYNSVLNLNGDGIMAYIEIPSIDCYLPIYHGVGSAVLQVAIGHIDWSTLPVGGLGTHCSVSGHRGLPSARLFTNLDQLVKGDLFLIHVLDEVLTYEVDQVLIVLPDELYALQPDPENDFVTLITCTPYGINSHRMLVRGHRIDNIEAASVIRVTADAIRIDPLVMTPLVAAPILTVLFIWLLFPSRKKKKK